MNEREARELLAMLIVATIKEFYGLPPGKTEQDLFNELMAPLDDGKEGGAE